MNSDFIVAVHALVFLNHKQGVVSSEALGVRFVEARWHSGDADKECLVASGMGGIMDGIFAELDECCRERLKQVTVASIDDRIFGGASAAKPA